MTNQGNASIDFERSLLLTDLYQLNMVEAYLATDMVDTAIFEFFVRKLPPQRGFLIAAGLEQAITFMLRARCSSDELEWLKEYGQFTGRLLEYVQDFRFAGDVDAIPEGTICFADEPIIRVKAPIAQAQLMETRLINFLHLQTLVASKAARMVLAASGRPLIDFGLRRAHGGEAGLLAARAAYIAGFSGTATVSAHHHFGIPIMGTMAHSFVQAHESEENAFRNFAIARPEQTVFLLDTYNTERAAEKVVALAPVLEREGISIKGVRLDSGDLGAHAYKVRKILDNAGLKDIRIVASGGLDEIAISELVTSGAPIDSFGVGTSLVTSEDYPALDCAYKLKAYGGKPKRKTSEGKTFWPGPTQVYRMYDDNGRMIGDTISNADETGAGEPLLHPVIRNGKIIRELPRIEAVRQHAADQLKRLPDGLKVLHPPIHYPVDVSNTLRELAQAVDAWAAG